MVSVASRRKRKAYISSLIDRIFEADSGVRFVAIYQEQHMLAGGMRGGRSSYDPEEEAYDIDLQLAKIGEMTRSWQKWFGNMNALVVSYEKLNLVFQPLSEGRFLVLSTEVGLNSFELLEKLAQQDYKRLADMIP
jgi:hypothetical protein